MVMCLEQGVDLLMAQLMPLPLIVSCFSKIQIGFAFLVPAHPGSPGQRAVKRVCVCLGGQNVKGWVGVRVTIAEQHRFVCQCSCTFFCFDLCVVLGFT